MVHTLFFLVSKSVDDRLRESGSAQDFFSMGSFSCSLSHNAYT